MTKRNKIIIILSAIVLAALLALGILAVVNYYKDLGDTGLSNSIPYGFGKDARVIILAGQSNAAGCSRDDYLQKNVTPEQYEKYKNGFDNVYINYYNTGISESHGFVKCKTNQGDMQGFFGPELGLAEKLSELYPNETIFIIKYAWSGTELSTLWRSPSSGGEVGQLYTGLIQYVKNSIEFLELKNYNVKIEAMCWMQGESDSVDEAKALEYESNLTHFVSDFRAEFNDFASGDGSAFIDAYIADSFFWTHYKTVNAAKQSVADSSEINVVINTIEHGLTVTGEPEGEPDIAHYDSLSEIKLGHLFAEECIKFFD